MELFYGTHKLFGIYRFEQVVKRTGVDGCRDVRTGGIATDPGEILVGRGAFCRKAAKILIGGGATSVNPWRQPSAPSFQERAAKLRHQTKAG